MISSPGHGPPNFQSLHEDYSPFISGTSKIGILLTLFSLLIECVLEPGKYKKTSIRFASSFKETLSSFVLIVLGLSNTGVEGAREIVSRAKTFSEAVRRTLITMIESDQCRG